MHLGRYRLLVRLVLVVEVFVAAGQVTAQQKAPVPEGAALAAAQTAAGELLDRKSVV